MKLRNKVLIALGLAWFIFLTITYIGSQTFLINSFLLLEHERANRDLSRIDEALSQINRSLYTFTSDWAHWNDAYRYINGKNPGFIDDNFNVIAFVNSTINLVTFWDKQGKLVNGEAINTDTKQFIPIPAHLDKQLPLNILLTNNKNSQHNTSTYALIDNKIYFIAAVGITDGKQSLAPSGTIINGRVLSPDIITTISGITKLNIKLTVLSTPAIRAANQPILNKIKNDENGHYIQLINEKNLIGFTLITNIFHDPIAMIQMDSSRTVYTTGKDVLHYYLISLMILAITFSLLILWLLNLLIIKRLERLDNEVATITSKQVISQRVHAKGTDELSTVAKAINAMLDIIQASHEKLKYKVKHRTEALIGANIHLEKEISERKIVEKELFQHKEHLARLAHYDRLTALPNRIYFNEIFNKALLHANYHKLKLAIMFIDLDRFRMINEGYGHPTGDQVLKEIAKRFFALLRTSDILSRLSGDEFSVLLNDIGQPKFASSVARKILQACSTPLIINNHEFYITASIGICIFPDDGTSLEDLEKHADIAMYKAKHLGGGVFQYFTPDMNIEAHEHILLETALHKALEKEEFVLYYQPKLDLKTNAVTAVEALIRWENPELGMVSPDKFISLAEDSGLIIPIGKWALQEACKAAKRWQDQGLPPISVAVNVSPKQFRHQDISKVIFSVLAETGLDPQYLEIEITESAIMANIDDVISRLNHLHKMGIKISIDDFGTGYTSISYFKQLPISVIKIDQSFIKGVPENQNDVAITTAIITMAHNLGIKVVAEGVETSEQLAFLDQVSCDLIQGYFISRPLPEPKIIALFKEYNNSKK